MSGNAPRGQISDERQACPCSCHGMGHLDRRCDVEGGCYEYHRTAPAQVRLDSLGRCRLCTLNARNGGTLCWRHHDQIARMLDPKNTGDAEADITASIPVMYWRLVRNLGPGGGGGEQTRRAPGFRSTPAASVHKLVMVDDRSKNDPQVWYDPHPSGIGDDHTKPHAEEESPVRAVRKALEGIADAFAESLEFEGPTRANGRYLTARTVHDLCLWMHEHVLDISAHPDADDMFDDLRELSDQLRPVIGDRKQAPEGWCLEFLKDRDTGQYRECGCPLYLPPAKPDPKGMTEAERQKLVMMTCRRCHRDYRWLDWVRLHYVSDESA